MITKAKRLSDPIAHELSIVFGEHKGQKFTPANPEAIVLGLKGKPVAANEGASFVERLKSWFVGAGDEPSNLDFVASLFCQAYYDLQNAMCINEDDVRQTAVEGVLAKFASEFDNLRSGSEKAGKRHSAADQAHIAAINDAHGKAQKAYDKLGKALTAVQEHADALTPAQDSSSSETPADDQVDEKAAKTPPESVGEDGLPATQTKNDRQPYGDVEYADPGYQSDGKKRYPIDTKEHAQAAWSYINKDSNASKYSSADLAKVRSRIMDACKKFGIKTSDDSSKALEAEELDMNQEQIDALVAKATDAAVAKAIEAVNAAKQAEIDAANATAEKAKADAAKATADAEAAEKAKADAEKAQADAEAAANAQARQPSTQSGGNETRKGESKLIAAVKAANAGSVIPVSGR